MNNQDIEFRLQNIINADKVTSKELAVKTKRLYKRLHFLENATDSVHKMMHEKRTQLMMAEKMLNEHREVLASLKESETTLRNQIQRLRKKVTDMKNYTNKSESITPDDRYVYTKNAFKKSLLGECIKIKFHDIKKSNLVTVMGYVAAKDKLHTFQEKISNESKQADESTILWNHIKLGSQHLDKWNGLFSN